MFNLSDLLKKEISCQLLSLPIKIGPIPPIQLPLNKPKAIQVSNVYWSSVPKNNDSRFKIEGNLTNYCGKQLDMNRNYKFEISFRIIREDPNNMKSWKIDEKSIRIAQSRDPWIRILEIDPF